MTLDQILQQAITYHQQNRLSDAEAFYLQVLALKPQHPTALHLMGVLLGQRGDPVAAVQWIDRAIAIHPGEPMYHFNRGIFSEAANQQDDAIAAFQQAVNLKPAWAEAWLKLGHARQSRAGDGDIEAAVEAYEAALQAQPENADAHNLLGAAYQAQGEHAAARKHYERAIALNPRLAAAHNNLGTLLRATGHLDAAIAAYRAALALQENFAEALNNLGLALQSREDVDQAIVNYQRALALKPDYVEALGNLGGAFKDCADLDSALACFGRSLVIRPDFAEAHSNLLFTMQYHPRYNSRAIGDEARRWSARYADPLRLPSHIQPYSNNRSLDRPLRVGYISPDFRDHCQSFFTLPLLSHHDHSAFHISLFSDVAVPDSVTAKIRTHADAWHNVVGVSDQRVAALIRREKIDILVDLTMHMADNRLLVFARRPAPVQVSWLAYPGTTGLSAIDFRLTDPFLDPPETPDIDACYSEQSVRLPETFWCYDPLTEDPPVAPLPADAAGHITFGSLNNFCKITPATLRLWGQVLTAVPGSRLLMLAPLGKSRATVAAILQACGVAQDRIEFVARLPRTAYLQVFNRIDIGLDTLPANGHTTSLDSYWMGVPVVTLVGKTITGRAGKSQLHNLQMTEWIAHTEEEFVSIATSWANSAERLRTLRTTFRDRLRASPLMDAPRFARNVENAYREMWRSPVLSHLTT